MTKFKINITQQVLEDSKMCKHEVGQNCAIAKAISQLFPYINVGASEITFYDNADLDGCYFADSTLPDEAIDFIAKFDEYTPEQRIKMQPFSFEIEVPDEVIDMVGIDEAHRILETSQTIELVNN